jgi:hypothetical protein
MATLTHVPRSNHIAKLLRFPPELEEEIMALARREYRTFSAQVFMMLREWLDARQQPKP